MGSVSIRDLSRNASRVVGDVSSSGRPAIVTRYGRAIAAVVPIDESDLEDFVLASTSRYVRALREADEDLRRGRTTEAMGFLDELEESDGVDGPRRARSQGSKRSGKAGRASASHSPARTAATRARG